MKFDNYIIKLPVMEDSEKFFLLIENNRKRLEDFFAGTVSKTKTLGDTIIFMTEKLKGVNEKSYFPFIIVDVTTENIVGFIDVKNIDWRIPKAELGCFIDEQYVGNNIAKKSLSRVIDHLFTEQKFNKVFLRTHEKNISARKLAESCGFKVEGMIRSDHKTTKGEIVDLLYYGLLKTGN
jgi:RimJ/RimL family protein N-acetyltransferase